MKFKDLNFLKINDFSKAAEIKLDNGGFLVVAYTGIGDAFNFTCFEVNSNRELVSERYLFEKAEEVNLWVNKYIIEIADNDFKKENIMVCFSGGRTSARMCDWLIKHMSHLYNFEFVYANTGLEHEKTLEFVNKCDKYFNLNLTWVEAVINKEEGVGTDYTIVNYETACRDNRIFKEMSAVYGLPNKTYIHCTRELKNQPMLKFANDYFGKTNHRKALGIRYDEPKRIKANVEIIYPFATITKMVKEDILDWWSKQPFDLEIPEYLGNCVPCFKKNHKKLKMVSENMPEAFNGMIEIENLYSSVKTKEELGDRKIYRYERTAFEVKNNLKYPEHEKPTEDCAEECGSVLVDYESIKIIVPEKTLFDF